MTEEELDIEDVDDESYYLRELSKLKKKLDITVKALKKQLEEANVVITSYIRNNPLEKYGPAEAYCERWHVK